MQYSYPPVEEDSSDMVHTHGDHLLKGKQLYGIDPVVEILHVDHAESSASRGAEIDTYRDVNQVTQDRCWKNRKTNQLSQIFNNKRIIGSLVAVLPQAEGFLGDRVKSMQIVYHLALGLEKGHPPGFRIYLQSGKWTFNYQKHPEE